MLHWYVVAFLKPLLFHVQVFNPNHLAILYPFSTHSSNTAANHTITDREQWFMEEPRATHLHRGGSCTDSYVRLTMKHTIFSLHLKCLQRKLLQINKSITSVTI